MEWWIIGLIVLFWMEVHHNLGVIINNQRIINDNIADLEDKIDRLQSTSHSEVASDAITEKTE